MENQDDELNDKEEKDEPLISEEVFDDDLDLEEKKDLDDLPI